MSLEESYIYHVYNRGNNSDRIFFQPRNYEYFMVKMKKHIAPQCNLLAFCLMPNHFHFLVQATKRSLTKVKSAHIEMNHFSKGLKDLLGGYTKGINSQEHRTGSLFTKSTRIKKTQDWTLNLDYSTACFNYIHQNPLRAGLVTNLKEWVFSSYHEFLSRRQNGLCNIKIAMALIDMEWSNFELISHQLTEFDGENLSLV